MFRNAFFSSTALAVSLVLSASAYAADPVVVADPVPFAQPDTDRFCGPYAGIQAGYTWGDTDWGGQESAYIEFAPSWYLDSGKHDGISGGLYAGCNLVK